jgi:hypothetical protein
VFIVVSLKLHLAGFWTDTPLQMANPCDVEDGYRGLLNKQQKKKIPFNNATRDVSWILPFSRQQ